MNEVQDWKTKSIEELIPQVMIQPMRISTFRERLIDTDTEGSSFYDMAFAYRVVTHCTDGIPVQHMSTDDAFVTKRYLREHAVSAVQFRAAVCNYAAEHAPLKIDRLEDILRRIDPTAPKNDPDAPKLLICSTGDSYGASVILYPHFLSTVRNRVLGSFFILPSSIHELLVLPAGKIGGAEQLPTLEKLVQAINKEQVKEPEQLSSIAFYYDDNKCALISSQFKIFDVK